MDKRSNERDRPGEKPEERPPVRPQERPHEPAEKAEQDAAHLEKEMGDMRASLERKTTECAEYRDTLLRLQAEFENYRKRMVREQTQFLERAIEVFVLQLLPIIDNLERAIAASEEKHDLEKLADGVKITHSQILDLFKKEGIEIVDPDGQEFDPTVMHAVLTVETEDYADNTVVEVLQKGYVLKGKVVRPAMVKVSRTPG
ncbi:MAG: nucleotide exchange factor GrpE [Actinobacteria bacterium]|nr:MAG: nucleotide exchange factor GrpE [Actinomycetota bacterium]